MPRDQRSGNVILSKIPCRNICSEVLHTRQSLCSCSPLDGQFVACLLHSQDGRYLLSTTFQSSRNSLGVVSRTPSSDFSTTSTQLPILKSRQGVKDYDRFQRLEDETFYFPDSPKPSGPIQCGSFWLTPNLQFASWRPDPPATYTDAFSLNWRGLQGYALPPFALIGRVLRKKFEPGGGSACTSAPSLAISPWYPLLLSLAVGLLLLFPVAPDVLPMEDQTHPLPNLQLAGWLLPANKRFSRNEKYFVGGLAKEHIRCLLLCLEYVE